MNKLTTKTQNVSCLSESLIANMYDLYSQYYSSTSYTLFKNDLTHKDLVLSLYDKCNYLQGFTTLQINTIQFQNKAIRLIFSGDTIIHHEYWGEQTLPLAWCNLVGKIKAEQPNIPLFWFLIVKGHRTYRYLGIFSKNYFPNRRNATPEQTQQLMDYLATHKFGNFYNKNLGLIQFPESHGHLKKEWINNEKAHNPEAKFFLQKNPTHHQGSELVCITELCESNLRSFALKGFQTGLEYERVELYS